MPRILFLVSFLLLVAGVYPDLLPNDKKEDLQGEADEPANPTPLVIVVTGKIPGGNVETTTVKVERTTGKVETITGNVETTTPVPTPGGIIKVGKPGSCPNPKFRPHRHKKFRKPRSASSSEEKVLSERKLKFYSSSKEFKGSSSSEERQKNSHHHRHGKKGHQNICKTPPCGEDGNCPDDLKCCLIHCGKRCVKPLPMLQEDTLAE